MALAGLVLLAACGSGPHPGNGTVRASPNPFFTSPFTTTANPVTFGQDPTWTPDGRVLSNENDAAGVKQIFVSGLDGSEMHCLTCGQAGPNGFPMERPQGDWILFCSWRGQTVTFGAPCLGGIGSDLYVMRPDGSGVTRLTAPAMTFETSPVYDNYHPAWSPDGLQLVWTHLDFLPQAQGGTQWTMLVADFTVGADGRPALSAPEVVGPAGNTAYETQRWAPDGSGFLYTAFTSAGDPGAGWLNTELFFLRLHGRGATPTRPLVSHLTDGSPGWDEQAVFTPDMRDVIWMSSRTAPTWYQTVVTAARQLGYDPPPENETAGPMFVLTILDPAFRTDLYELDLSSHAIRRLTDLGSVVPEFTFDPSGTRLLWSETLGGRATEVGRFALPAPPRRPGPIVTPSAAWQGAPRTGHLERPAPAQPATAPTGPAFNAANIPASVVDGLLLLQTQLATLAQRLGGLAQGATCCRAGP